MRALEKYFSFLTHETRYPFALRTFTIGVYTWFLVMALSMWEVKHLIWGTDSILMRFVGDSSPLTNISYALMYQHSLFPWVYYPHIIAAIVSMFQFKGVYIFRMTTWLTGVLLFYAGINVYNASFLMMLLFAFYLIPVNTQYKKGKGILLNQLSYSAIIIQLCLVYFLSALYKLSGEMWIKGEAIYYTLELNRFSREWITAWGITKWHWFMISLNYLVIAYQILFPITIFISRMRKVMLFIGITMHISIALFMGLWDFSTAMLLSYLILFRK